MQIAHLTAQHGQRSRPSLALRMRYQIGLGILIAVVCPVIIRAVFTGVGLEAASQYNTAIGGIVALLIGYLSYRRLTVFPGIISGSYVVMCFSIAFAALAIVMFLLRLDYSRLQLLSSFVLSLGFFLFVHLAYLTRRPIVLGVIPNGATNRLPQVPRVLWHQLSEPNVVPPHLDGVVVDLNEDHSADWDSRITRFVMQGTPVYHVKDAVEHLIGRVEIDRLGENTLGALNPNALYLRIKAAIDILAALALIVICGPVMLLVAVAIRLDSTGPALFRQARTGFRAQPFTVYKFRTMRTAPSPVDASHESARTSAITLDNDPRITRIGNFLRRTRLDELPQLINVIRGEMSLIGPRPEAVALTQWYEAEIPFYHYRHIIKPGVTGWAQVNQGHVADVSDVREKLNLDFYYVKNFSAWLDMLIVLRTIHTMVTRHGAK